MNRALTTIVGCALLVTGLLAPLPAQANVGIETFSALPSATQAGSHPDFGFSFFISNRQFDPSPCACKDAKDVIAHLPAGFIGNPHALPQCTIADFSSNRCPSDSQLGITEVYLSNTPFSTSTSNFIAPVYNLVPPPSQPALLGFKSALIDSPTFEDVSARTGGDYGLDVAATSINHIFPLRGFEQFTWGVPAAHLHDDLRFAFGQPSILALSVGGGFQKILCDASGNPATTDPATVHQLCIYGEQHATAIGEFSVGPPDSAGPGYPIVSQSPEEPFVQSPTTCGETSLLTSMDVVSYDGGSSHADNPWPATTDCAQLQFNPSQSIEPTTQAADSPSGAEFRLTVPQFESPSVPSPSELKAAVVTLPEGFSFAPNVTNGKQTCSDAQAKFGTTEEAQCPENSKVGAISVETPVLPGVLHGAVYLGEPKPGDRFRLILAFDGFGVHVKLAGSAFPDPKTGQIVISFQNLPQAPFALFNAHFFGSERGPLDTPGQCGAYEVQSVFTPWDAALPNVTSRQFFHVTEGPGGTPCPNGKRPFAPGFQAASSANTAGAHTGFSLNLTRQDGNQNLAALNVTTPPGFSATLKGLTYCPEAAIAAAALSSHAGLTEQATPSCPASSYVGEVIAGAGPGAHPLYLPGKAYLAGPYKGAPLSFVFITPAVSGGYDLGNVVIRAALRIDPETAQVTAVSDPLPRIFEGIPLRLRSVMINLNRPGFGLNPTSCDPLAVTAQAFGDETAVANLTQHFQVANCASLPFAPKLSLKLTGGLHRLGHPAIHAVVTTQPGEANPSSIAVTLPPNELLDNGHIVNVCTKVNFAARSCPAGSLLGHAEVTSPLLDQPLTGNAYLRSSGRGLPDIALDLYGQIHIEAVARVDSVNGGLRTTFKTVPDVPLGSVALNLQGGSKGLVQNSESLCGHHFKANVVMSGQNGKGVSRKVPLQAACGKAAKHKRGGGR